MSASITPEARFAIISLPRSGSTTLANVLNLHPSVRCLIEPFHPGRYGGQFHRFARKLSVPATLQGIWTKWTSIKHVWDAAGFPFPDNPALNDDVVRVKGQSVVLLVRANQLKRLVSHHICLHTRYWIGTQSGFRSQLDRTSIPPLQIEQVREDLRRDHGEVERRITMLEREKIQHIVIRYEDLFTAQVERQQEVIARILSFIGLPAVGADEFIDQWWPMLDTSANQWATAEVYRRIPDIELVDCEVGSDLTGRLFSD